VILEDSPEPALIFFMIHGALIYLGKPESGTFAAMTTHLLLSNLAGRTIARPSSTLDN